METKDGTNGLLKATAILMIVFAVIGVAVMALMMWQMFGDMRLKADQLIDTEAGIAEARTLLTWLLVVQMSLTVIGNLPRLIAGIMGLSRCKKPEKHDFFVAWGVVLLVLGVIGLALATSRVLTANWLVSLVGGVILPVCYISGGLWQKRLYIEQKAGEPIVRELTYPTADEVSEPDEG